jgi:hypothetical protein
MDVMRPGCSDGLHASVRMACMPPGCLYMYSCTLNEIITLTWYQTRRSAPLPQLATDSIADSVAPACRWSNRPHPQPAADPIACPVDDFVTGRSRWSARASAERWRTTTEVSKPPPSSTFVPSSPSCSIRPQTPTASGVACSSSFSANMP